MMYLRIDIDITFEDQSRSLLFLWYFIIKKEYFNIYKINKNEKKLLSLKIQLMKFCGNQNFIC